jgi:hypothetical protein
MSNGKIIKNTLCTMKTTGFLVTVSNINKKNPKYTIIINVKNIVKNTEGEVVKLIVDEVGRFTIKILIHPKRDMTLTEPLVVFCSEEDANLIADHIEFIYSQYHKE